MFTSMQNPLTLVGRILLALLFIPAGLSKIGGFEGTVGYISSVGLPMASVAAVMAIIIEVGAGAALLIGWQTRWAALALAVFTLVAAVAFHNFWAMPAEQVMIQQIMFFKNLAIIGGLLGIMAWGAGALSIDGRRR